MPSVTSVTIGSVDYAVYADQDYAGEYIAGDPTNYATWAALEADQQKRLNVQATRIFDRMVWQGEKTDTDQANEWPRTGITDVDEDTLPQRFVDGSVELMIALMNGVDVANLQSTANTTKRLKAGSVEIEYFRGAEGQPYRLPLPVWELVSQWLGSAASSIVSTSAGTDGCSEFVPSRYGFNQGI